MTEITIKLDLAHIAAKPNARTGNIAIGIGTIPRDLNNTEKFLLLTKYLIHRQ